MLQRAFLDHPASVNETYSEHLGMAWGFAWQLLKAATMCFVHGLFPCFFTNTASRSIANLHDTMVEHRKVKPD
jgi:hypothetical protein